MKKRILALSLAAAMLVGAMASCNAKEEVVSSQAVEARDISLTLWGSPSMLLSMTTLSPLKLRLTSRAKTLLPLTL